VLNLSAVGMRVGGRGVRSRRVGQRVAVELPSHSGTLVLDCVVAWVRRTGLMGYEVGLTFQALPEGMVGRLAELARLCA
jgi:hypothetical protein